MQKKNKRLTIGCEITECSTIKTNEALERWRESLSYIRSQYQHKINLKIIYTKSEK